MFSSLASLSVQYTAFVLVAVQLLAALPWINALAPGGLRGLFKNPANLGIALGVLVGGTELAALYIGYKGQSEGLAWTGRYYAAILHVQLVIDFCLLAPALLTLAWPKGGAVAQAAFREGCRQPMFWLITAFGTLALGISVWVPYFTFGDDYKMMKQIGYDIIMLSAALFGVLAASMSISEEIEGRTAITLLSKPINRRQFLIGKYLGILLACLVMSLILAWFFNFYLKEMADWDPINKADDPLPAQARPTFVQPLQSV